MTEPTQELAFETATSLRPRFLSGELSPVDVVDSVLAQIEQHNGDRERGINALTEVFPDEARAAARAAQELFAKCRRSGDDPPALLGVPVAAKEKHFLAGMRHSEGYAPWAQRRAEADHPLITRLRDAGAIIHARTTTPEFSASTFTHSRLWGTTRNPWNLAATPGGSSGGSAAALAAGMTVLATASDIGGSTRVPAGFCGLLGYKAPYGRVPGVGALSADTYRGDGGLARTVDDMALLHGVLAGRHPTDHRSWGPNGTPEFLGLSAELSGLRIAMDMHAGDFPVSAAVSADFAELAEALRRAGAEVTEVSFPFSSDTIIETAQMHFGQIISQVIAESIADDPGAATDYVHEVLHDSAHAAQTSSLIDSLRADATVQQQIAGTMAGFDVMITPTQGAEMLAAEQDIRAGFDVDGVHVPLLMKAHMTLPFNIANSCPVMAIPMGVSPSGVPTSAQVIGHPYDERMVFTVSRAIEQLLPSARAARPAFDRLAG
ncbi:amidase [Leucobacter albus]|uniref:Amidase n=1 Tax=Leucobacter albus TaxID=272210 RepID=A0ABW3TUA6_9MICO